jgi:phospholipase C
LKKLEQNPDMYAKSVFILNYDEGGQFYDHAWTPTPPLSESEGISTVTVEGEINTDVLTDVPAPIGLGFRVPLLIISPWTRGDIVVSEIFDHTSVLKFLEERFGLQVPTISPWRRAMVGNLLSAFDFDHPDYSWPQNLPDTSDYVKEAEIECLTLPDVVIPSEQTMPVQEPGTKVSKALPYEFLVRDTMDFNIGSINITISNVGKAGAPFVSYDVIQIESVNPRQYAVEAGKQISDALYVPLSANHSYSFYLLGANGFVRTFAGIFDFSTRVSSHLSYDYDADKSNVVLHMQNDNTEDVEFVVVDNCYGLLPSPKSFHVSAGSGAIFELDVLTTGNWYDLTVSLAFNASLAYENGSLFERRFMGRMETGKDTISDPCMAEGKPGLPLLKRDAGGVGRVIQAPQNHPLLPEKLTRLSRVESRAAKRNKDAQFHYVQVEAV